MLLTEHGQVYTWGGGSRGQLGHGTLASEERPRSVMVMIIVKLWPQTLSPKTQNRGALG